MCVCAVQEDQDGGKGGVGTVIEISPWRGEDDPFKFGVRVKWDRNGKINLCVMGPRCVGQCVCVGRG